MTIETPDPQGSTPSTPQPAFQADIAIVIPHLNDAERLERCLTALAQQTFDPSRVEIIVVDNGSKIPPVDVVARFPQVRLVHETTPGPGPARNLGAAMTTAPILAFTDSDCLPDPGWTAAILDRFAQDPGLEVLGGDIQITVARPGQPNPAEAFELLYGFRQDFQIRRHRFSASANLAMRRPIFEVVGPFGDISVSEDLDWGQRAAALGHVTVYVEQAIIRHPARQDMPSLYKQWNRHVHHFYPRVRERRLGRLRWLLTIPAMALSPLAEIPTVLRSEKLSGPGQRWQAFRTLVDVRFYRAGQMLRALVTDGASHGGPGWNQG